MRTRRKNKTNIMRKAERISLSALAPDSLCKYKRFYTRPLRNGRNGKRRKKYTRRINVIHCRKRCGRDKKKQMNTKRIRKIKNFHSSTAVLSTAVVTAGRIKAVARERTRKHGIGWQRLFLRRHGIAGQCLVSQNTKEVFMYPEIKRILRKVHLTFERQIAKWVFLPPSPYPILSLFL